MRRVSAEFVCAVMSSVCTSRLLSIHLRLKQVNLGRQTHGPSGFLARRLLFGLHAPWYAPFAFNPRPRKYTHKYDPLRPSLERYPQRCSARRESHPDAAVDRARYDDSDSHAPASITVR